MRPHVKSALGGILQACLFCCAVFVLSSCAGSTEGSGKNVGGDVRKLSCLIVLPTGTPIDTDKRMGFAEAKNLQKGAIYIDGVIGEELKNFKGARLLNASQVESLASAISGNRIGMVANIGRELRCEAILTVVVSRYHQREGGEFASDYPASAAFTMELVRVQDGKVIWNCSFDETQESLLSNLFSFGKAQNRGFRWISVEELVRQGVHERLVDCPYLE
jgi:hypothetical protein